MNMYPNKIKSTLLASCLALVFLIRGIPGIAAGEVFLGSPDFRPSPQQPVGWRGDGTGKYPGANPPIHWSRICKQTAALKCSSAIPTNQSLDRAASAKFGFFTEWLVASPISSAGKTNAINEELVPGEASLAPQEGDKIGETAWKRVATEDSCLDIMKLYGPMTPQQAAYAQTCLYSEKPVKIWVHIGCSKEVAVWLDGTLKYSAKGSPVFKLELKSGWNRFLFKMTPQLKGQVDFPECCYVKCRFWPADEPLDYEEKNIAWIAPLPGESEATPMISGDRIFTTAHPYNLVCLDKKTGKIIWIRQNSAYDAATEDEKKAKPELFAKLDELAAKRSAYYSDYIAGKLTTNQTSGAEQAIEDQMDKLMVEVDQKYKRPGEQGEADWWEIPTPCSDGNNICVFMEQGVSACYDPDGNRRWVRYERPLPQHHGFFGSPVIAGGKFFILDGRVTGLDLKDGSVKSSFDLTKTKGGGLAFASLGRIVFDGTEYVLYPDVSLFRASDGKLFGPARNSSDMTPVFSKPNLIVWNDTAFGRISVKEIEKSADGGVTIQDHPKKIKWNGEIPIIPGFYQGHYFEASPVVNDGLIHLVRCWGSLAVIDLATMELLYEHALPLDLFHAEFRRDYMGASLAMAGDYLYIMGATGVMIVVKPGRKYEEAARNRIHDINVAGKTMRKGYWFIGPYDYQDSTMTGTPIFDGNRMYYRGFANLYCVEQNVWALMTADVSEGETPLTVKFDAGKSYPLPGRKIKTYTWDFGDVQAGSPQALRKDSAQAEHTYANAGTYLARLTVTDDQGASDEVEATITVTPVDTMSPTIKSVAADGERGETNLIVRFNEPVERTSAGNVENYALSQGVKILGAALEPDASAVTLATTPLAEKIKYTLTVNNIKDCARKANTINAKSQQSFYRFRSPPDEEGYIRNWLMLPPIPQDLAGEKELFSKEYFPGQKSCAPNEGDKVTVDGRELAWKASLSNDAVIALSYGTKKEVFFGVVYIECNEDIPDLRLRIGGSHDSSLWSLNGRELIRVNVNRGLGLDQRVSESVMLKKGRNVLRMEVVNTWGGGFCARFVDKDGNPIGNYNVSPAAPSASASVP